MPAAAPGVPLRPSCPLFPAAPFALSVSLVLFCVIGTVLLGTTSLYFVDVEVLLLVSRSAATVTAAWPGPRVRLTMSSIFFSTAAS